MLRAGAGSQPVRHLDTRRRLDEVRTRSPESGPWLDLLEAALAETEDAAAWDAIVPEPRGDRPGKAPLLFGTAVSVHPTKTRRWVRSLTRIAQLDIEPSGALAFLEAAINQRAPERDEPVLRVVGQMAALPLLHACARVLEHGIPAGWWEGYCPVCGGWPILAELRGLDRKRWLRCGRCAAAWEAPTLRCPFCGETEHERLGYLAPEGDRQSRTVEVCHRCKGYVKALTTILPVPPWALLLEDLAAVPLDVVAIEKGFERPERAAYDLDVRLRERPLTAGAIRRLLSTRKKVP